MAVAPAGLYIPGVEKKSLNRKAVSLYQIEYSRNFLFERGRVTDQPALA